jgi:hypothetical protein
MKNEELGITKMGSIRPQSRFNSSFLIPHSSLSEASSPAFELWLALFDKSGHAFLLVFGGEG